MRPKPGGNAQVTSGRIVEVGAQGISAGWADAHRRHLPWQYIVIDDVPDGDYRLRVDVYAARVLAAPTWRR